MTNNDIIRRLRYVFDYNDLQMVEIFKHANHTVETSEVIAWLSKDEDPINKEITDRELAIFLNGLIIEKRGKKEGPQPEPEDPLTNNMILRKLRIALDLQSDNILDMFQLVDVRLSKHELSAFFRRPTHHSYKPLLDQYLRNFMNALQLKYKKSVS